MGALPGADGADNPTWQSFQYGYGPYVDGIFTQSNFGIVTKMGLWLMPATEHLTFMVTFPNDDDFEDIIDVIRQLMVKRILGNVPQLRHVIQELAVTGKNREEFYRGEGQIPREVIRQHASKMPCGDCSWVFYGRIPPPLFLLFLPGKSADQSEQAPFTGLRSRSRTPSKSSKESSAEFTERGLSSLTMSHRTIISTPECECAQASRKSASWSG